MDGVTRSIVFTDKAAAPLKTFSQAVIVDKTIYIAGQLGVDPVTMTMVPGGVQAECRQALKNMKAILESVGADMSHVVKATVLLADINDFSSFNEVYAEYFPTRPPARAAYQVAALPKGARIEIESVAMLGPIKEKMGSQQLGSNM